MSFYLYIQTTGIIAQITEVTYY